MQSALMVDGDNIYSLFKTLSRKSSMKNSTRGSCQWNRILPERRGLYNIYIYKKHLHINWSNFKLEFSGKPEEDAEMHLLCSNDWMNAHRFADGIKIQRFCLALLGEARLWFQSLEPLDNVI